MRNSLPSAMAVAVQFRCPWTGRAREVRHSVREHTATCDAFREADCLHTRE